MEKIKRFFFAVLGKETGEGPEEFRSIRIGNYVHNMLMHNIGLKILALVLAIMAWSYIVAETNPVVRKNYTDVHISVVGVEQLRENGYSLKEETETVKKLTGTVAMDVNFKTALNTDASDILIVCDVSEIDSKGSNRVKLKAQTDKGTVVSVTPEYLTLEFDTYAEVEIPVSYELTGTLAEDKSIDVPTLSVSSVKVGGPEEYIRNLARADVRIELDNISDDMFPCALPLVLRNTAGEEVSVPNLVKYESKVTVFMNVYGRKTVAIDVIQNLMNLNKLAEGYEIVETAIYPKGIVLIGDTDVLDGISSIGLKDYIDLNGEDKTVAGNYALDIPGKLRTEDGENTVYVKVEIAEKTVEKELNVPVTVRAEGKNAVCSVGSVTIKVTAPYHYAKELKEDTVTAYVQVATDHTAGTQSYPIQCECSSFPGKEIGEYAVVTMTLTEATVTVEEGQE